MKLFVGRGGGGEAGRELGDLERENSVRRNNLDLRNRFGDPQAAVSAKKGI